MDMYNTCTCGQTCGQGWGEEGKNEINGESNMDAYTLICKYIANGNFLYDLRNSNPDSVIT